MLNRAKEESIKTKINQEMKLYFHGGSKKSKSLPKKNHVKRRFICL